MRVHGIGSVVESRSFICTPAARLPLCWCVPVTKHKVKNVEATMGAHLKERFSVSALRVNAVCDTL